MPIFLALLLGQSVAVFGARRRARRVRQAWLLAAATLMLTTSVIFLLFNWRHYSPQGRYFYVMLAPFGAITAYGCLALLPPAWRQGAGRGLVWLLVALNLWCLWHFQPGLRR